MSILSLAALVGILTSAIRLATPYLYASIGESFGQLSGVVNLGVDGIMLVGAFAAFSWLSLPAVCGWVCWPQPSSGCSWVC